MEPFRIVLDGRPLGQRASGDETYVAGLLQGLAELDVPHTVDVACPRPDRATRLIPRHPRIRLIPAGPSATVLRGAWTLPRLARRPRTVLHVLLYPPPVSNAPLVLYVPDASFLTHPRFFPRRIRWRLLASVGYGVRRARQIVTLSHDARRTLQAHYGLPEERIAVTYCGVDHRQFRPLPTNAVSVATRRLGLPEHYLLYVGNLHPRKNLVSLLDAYADLCRGNAAATPPLVVTGLARWQAAPIFQHVHALGLGSRVQFTGWVEQDDLPWLLAGAQVLVYPSLVEGFGLPPLEAMACGVPVVALDTSVFPEVLGKAALLVPPGTTGLARGIRVLLDDTAAHAHYAAAGIQRAAHFHWRDCAAATVSVYESAAAWTGRAA